MDNKYDTSNLNKYLETLNEKDEVRIALENLSKGNFENSEKDVNAICYLFVQYNMLIDNQRELLGLYKMHISTLNQTISTLENYKKRIYIMVLIVICTTFIIYEILSLIFM